MSVKLIHLLQRDMGAQSWTKEKAKIRTHSKIAVGDPFYAFLQRPCQAHSSPGWGQMPGPQSVNAQLFYM